MKLRLWLWLYRDGLADRADLLDDAQCNPGLQHADSCTGLQHLTNTRCSVRVQVKVRFGKLHRANVMAVH